MSIYKIKEFIKSQLIGIRYTKLSRMVWGVILAIISFIISKFFGDYTLGQNISETIGGLFLLVPIFYFIIMMFYATKNFISDIINRKDKK